MSVPTQRQQPTIACEECRRKRIRCDKATPQCTACATSGATCIVRESCPRRGPKKGYLKALQNKIDDLQARLDKQQAMPMPEVRASSPPQEGINTDNEDGSSMENDVQNTGTTTPMTTGNIPPWPAPVEFQFPIMPLPPWDCMDTSYPISPFAALDPQQDLTQGLPMGSELHITPVMHNDLDQLYFDRAYVFAPILQAHRYRSWSKQTNKSKEKTCLQRAMWTLASSLSSQFQVAGRQFYAETRQLLHALESEEPGHQISIEQAQAWTLLAIYELTCEDYHRGMMTAGRAFRLIQIMRLYELDTSPSPSTKQAPKQEQWPLNPQGQVQEDWIDLETKRRTFWLAYTLDRFTSMVDGLHLFFDERMIRTRLPAPEVNFASGRPMDTSFLTDMIRVIDLEWSESELSSLQETVIVATICGQVLEHKQRPPARTRDSTATTYDFCRRHRSLNALLAQRIKMLRMHASFEHLNPVFNFTALATYIAVLMLYDVIQSKPLGTETQATQLTKALHSENQQQSLDAVADIALLVTALGQHFQTHPLAPILLLLAARFSQTHPELNDAYNKLMPCILSALQSSTNLNKLAQSFLQLLGPQTDNGQPVT
ncbi:putative fungal-specific transcription factor [Aspergillus floccosus]